MSSSSGSGIFIEIPLLIFAASNTQFDMPTKAICLSPSFKSYSNSEWMTLKVGYLDNAQQGPFHRRIV